MLQLGVIDKFYYDMQRIIELVVRDIENKGMFEEVVMLYDLGDVSV